MINNSPFKKFQRLSLTLVHVVLSLAWQTTVCVFIKNNCEDKSAKSFFPHRDRIEGALRYAPQRSRGAGGYTAGCAAEGDPVLGCVPLTEPPDLVS
jgi:hypothetical protein